MKPLIALAGVVGIALLACQSRARAVPPRLARPFTHAESLAHLDPSEACDFIPRQLNPDPVSLVAEYIRRDNEGQFLGQSTWLDTAYTCPGHLPGPDMFTVVRSTRIVGTALSDTLTTVVVISDVLGDMGQDSIGLVFEPRPRTQADTFVVSNSPFGWRIDTPQLPDNVSASWVLTHPDRIKLREPNRARLIRARDLPHNER